jgi:hypothetical protein
MFFKCGHHKIQYNIKAVCFSILLALRQHQKWQLNNSNSIKTKINTKTCIYTLYIYIYIYIHLYIYDTLDILYLALYVQSDATTLPKHLTANTRFATSGAGTSYPSRVHPWFLVVTRYLVFCVMFCGSYCSFVLFLLAIVLSVLRWFTDSDYPFRIFKLFLSMKDKSSCLLINLKFNILKLPCQSVFFYI